jgi:hypothetical protein
MVLKMTKAYKNGSASICTWELEFYFRKEEQIREFITLLMKEDILYDFEYEKTLQETSTLHYIRISGCWANNLVAVAKLADSVDYKWDISEAYDQ